MPRETGETVSETGAVNDPLLRYPGQWAVPRAEELNLPTLYTEPGPDL